MTSSKQNLAENSAQVDRIVPQLQSRDRWEAIDELVRQLVLSHQILAPEAAAAALAVKSRERSRATGIGSGIAIPHARTPLVKELAWTFGRKKNGLDFQGPDRQPARFVFLFLVPDDRFEENVATLARISALFHGDQVLQDLDNAPDAAALLQILLRGLN